MREIPKTALGSEVSDELQKITDESYWQNACTMISDL
jgi:hypothetical protein